MTFEELQRRLVSHLRRRISSGELTERNLARLTHISQPHMHNVLKGKRTFSIQAADTVLRELQIDILDLIDPADLTTWQDRR